MSTHPHETRRESLRKKEFLSPAEFAEITGLALVTVNRYLAKGRLPKVQYCCRCRVLIPATALSLVSSDCQTIPAESAAVPDAPVKQEAKPARSINGRTPNWKKRRQSRFEEANAKTKNQ